MRKYLRWAGAALLGLLLVVPSVLAQEKYPDPRLTVFGSGSFLQGERAFTLGGDSFRTNFAKGGKLGFRGTVNLTDHWALEGVYSFGRNNLRITELGAVPRERAFGVRLHQFAGNALYYLNKPGDQIRFFATGGLGLARFNPTDRAKQIAATVEFVEEPAALQSDNKVDFNFGGGVEAKVFNRFGIRFDLRDHISKIPRFGVPQNPTPGVADFFPVDGTVHNIESSVGIVFHLAR